MPSEAWNRARHHQKMVSGEEHLVAIGQGTIAGHPGPLGYMIGGIIMGGRFHQPILSFGPAAPEVDFSHLRLHGRPITARECTRVNEARGTGFRPKLAGIEFSGDGEGPGDQQTRAGASGQAMPTERQCLVCRLHREQKCGDRGRGAWCRGGVAPAVLARAADCRGIS